MTIEEWKNKQNGKRQKLLAEMARVKASLELVELQLLDPEKYHRRALKETTKYQKKKIRKSDAVVVPPKPDLGKQIAEAAERAIKQKKFDPLDI